MKITKEARELHGLLARIKPKDGVSKFVNVTLTREQITLLLAGLERLTEDLHDHVRI